MSMAPGIVVLVLALASCAWLFRSAPRLRIGEDGLRLRGSGLGPIPWNAIEGAWQPSVADGDGLHVRLRAARLPRRRGRGRLTVRLDLSGTGMTPVDVLQEILRRAGGPPASTPPGTPRPPLSS